MQRKQKKAAAKPARRAPRASRATTKPFAFRLPDGLVERLTAEAERQNISRNKLVEAFCEYGLRSGVRVELRVDVVPIPREGLFA